MITQHIILATGWILYGFLHSLLAASVVKKYLLSFFKGNDQAYRIVYNFIAIGGLYFLIRFQMRISSPFLFETNLFTKIISIVLMTTGVSVMFICIAKYFRQFSGLSPEINEQLEVKGLHRYVRHPLYVGTFLLVTGLCFLFPLISSFITAAIIIIYTFIGIGFEEKKLVEKFGIDYENYRSQTPMIVPRLFFRQRM